MDPNQRSKASQTATVKKLLEDRAAKRAAKAAERRAKSEKLKEEGNKLYKQQDFVGAVQCYQQAVGVHGLAAKPVLLNNLAAAYLKLDMTREAHIAAMDALVADPKSIKARFRRGVARQEMNFLSAAAVDFKSVLKMDPNNAEANSRLGFVEELLFLGEGEETGHSDDEFPAPEDPSMAPDSESGSSDCEHEGNNIPCRFYNHDGCMKGRACAYSHAPDNLSERDGLGKNVCVYFLMGICKFGDAKCVYSHTKDCLQPKDGWWTTQEGRDNAKEVQKLQQQQDRHTEAFIENYILNLRDSLQPVRQDRGRNAPGSSKPKPKSKPKSKPKPKGKKGRVPTNYGVHSDQTRVAEDYTMMFSESDVEELLSQGVKPWDEDACDVLAALSI